MVMYVSSVSMGDLAEVHMHENRRANGEVCIQ